MGQIQLEEMEQNVRQGKSRNTAVISRPVSRVPEVKLVYGIPAGMESSSESSGDLVLTGPRDNVRGQSSGMVTSSLPQPNENVQFREEQPVFGQFEDAEEPPRRVVFREDPPERRREVTHDTFGAYDAHFHLDRSSILLQGDVDLTMDDWLQRPLYRQPTTKVEVTGGTIVYCDPAAYPTADSFPDNRWKIAVGIHPRLYASLTEQDFCEFGMLLTHPRVSALGEVGIDWTEPSATWGCQDQVLHRILSLSHPDQPIVLHVRGTRRDINGQEAYLHTLDILREHCPAEQRIQLHCFNGGVDIVNLWREKFPNAYFSFSGMVDSFNREQQRALVEVPAHRLLIETDSPYFGKPNMRVNSPIYVGEVAASVAHIRRETIADVLHDTSRNARILFP